MPKKIPIQVIRDEIGRAIEPAVYEATIKKIYGARGSVDVELLGSRSWIRDVKVIASTPMDALVIGGPCLITKSHSQWFCIGAYTNKARQESGSNVHVMAAVEVMRWNDVSDTDWTDLQVKEIPQGSKGVILGLAIRPNDSNGGYLIVRKKGNTVTDDYQPWVGSASVGYFLTTQVIVGVDFNRFIQFKIGGVVAPDTCNIRIRVQGYLKP